MPVALLAGGFWRASVAAGLTVVMATVATVVAFGLAPWHAFFASLDFTRHVILEQGGPGFGKLQSAFAAIRLLEGSIALAYVAQSLTTLVVLLALAWLWRTTVDHRLKAAGLMVAALLTTPYSMDYDMAVLAPALALLVAHAAPSGFPPLGKTLLAFVWLMPLLARPVATSLWIPLGLIAMLMLFWHIIKCAHLERLRLERDFKVTALDTQTASPL